MKELSTREKQLVVVTMSILLNHMGDVRNMSKSDVLLSLFVALYDVMDFDAETMAGVETLYEESKQHRGSLGAVQVTLKTKRREQEECDA